MTLAAAFYLNTIPIVMADMLISKSGGQEQPGLRLPASGPVSNLPSNRPVLHGMRQKVAVIADNFVIAFADREASGMLMVKLLRKLAAKQAITIQGLEAFQSANRTRFEHVCIVGFLVDYDAAGQRRSYSIRWRANIIETKFLGSVAVAGTGVELVTSSDHDVDPNKTSPSDAINSTLCFLANLIREEHATGTTVAKAQSGGSYEFAYFDGQRFTKYRDFTLIAWDVELRNEVFFAIPFVILRQFYCGRDVVLNVARWDQIRTEEQGDHRHYLCDTHIVPPTDRPEPVAKIGTFDLGFHSDTTVHSILVSRGELRSLATLVEHGETGFHSFATEDTPFGYILSPEFASTLEQIARDEDCRLS